MEGADYAFITFRRRRYHRSCRLLDDKIVKLFEALEFGECRFVVAGNTPANERSGSAHLFCAAPVIEGKSYCAKHWRACHSANTYQARAKDRKLANEVLVAMSKNSRGKID
jgi:hypothetical protein